MQKDKRRHEHIDVPMLIHLAGIHKRPSFDTEAVPRNRRVLDFVPLVRRAKVVGAFAESLSGRHLVFVDLDSLAFHEGSLGVEYGTPKECLGNCQ